MKKAGKIILIIGLGLLVGMAVLGGYWAIQGGRSAELEFGDNPGLPTLTFYTTPGATTPQMPFWAGVASGEILKLCNLRVRFWKDLDGLRALVLAGKGDLWLGHVEGFAQAALNEAPVQLMAVSGWRKFYFLAKTPRGKRLEAMTGSEMPFTPPGSPAVPLMRALEKKGAPVMSYAPYEPRQLALSLMEGKVRSALAPEPLATVLLTKVPGLEVVGSLEDLYARFTGGEARMPIAGLAINGETALKHPHLAKALTAIMVREAQRLSHDPEKGLGYLPAPFKEAMPEEIIRKSLARDVIMVRPADQVENEIARYLAMLVPRAVDENGRLVFGNQFIAR